MWVSYLRTVSDALVSCCFLSDQIVTTDTRPFNICPNQKRHLTARSKWFATKFKIRLAKNVIENYTSLKISSSSRYVEMKTHKFWYTLLGSSLICQEVHDDL